MIGSGTEKYMVFGGGGADDGDFGIAADEMIALSGREHPRFLFIGFAQLEPHHGFEYYGELFKSRGADCSFLTQDDADAVAPAREKILWADIIFIMGGNTGKLMRTLRGAGLDRTLREAALRGAVTSGFSAGGICLCSAGVSKNEDYLVEDGIGCLDLFFCPHPMSRGGRYETFKRELKTRGGTGLACDGAGFEVAGSGCRALVFCPNGYMAKICGYRDGEWIERDVPTEWTDLASLMNI